VCLAIGGLECRGLVDQQGVPGETRVPLAALGVEDPERRPAPRRPVAVVGHECLGPLPDDITSEPDPRPARQLEADAGRFGDRGREAARQSWRVEDQQQRLGPPRERGQSMQAVAHPRRLVGPGQSTAGEVEDEQVDRPTGEQRARDAEPLIQARRGDDHEPVEVDAASDRLDRVEAARQVEPGDDGALGLCLGGDPQREGRPAARAIPPDGDAGRLGQATRSEDRVEGGEAGPDDPITGSRIDVWRLVDLSGVRRQGECPDDPRSCGTPAGPEARHSGVHITPTGRHETPRIERMF